MSEEADQLHVCPGVGNGRVGNTRVDQRAISFNESLCLAVLPQHSLSPDYEDDLLTIRVKVWRPALVSIQLHHANREGIVFQTFERVDDEAAGPLHVVVG